MGCRLRDVDLQHLRAGGNQVTEAHRELVQPRADHEHEIRLGNQVGRLYGGETPGDAQVAHSWTEQVGGQHRTGAQRTNLVGQQRNGLGRPGEAGAAAVEDDRAPRGGQGLGVLSQQLGRGRWVMEGRLEFGQHDGRFLGRRGRGDVVRNGQHDGGTLAQRVGHGLAGNGGRPLGVEDERGGTDGGIDGALVDVPGAQPGGRGLSDDQQRGNLRHGGFGQPGDGIGETGTVGRGGDGQLAGDPEVSVGRGDGGTLMAHRREVQPVTDGGVEKVGVSVAHDAEDFGDVV